MPVGPICWVGRGYTQLKMEYSASSQIHSPWMGDIVDSGIGLSYRPTSLRSLAGRYNNPLPESTLSPSQGLWIWLLVCAQLYLRETVVNSCNTRKGFYTNRGCLQLSYQRSAVNSGNTRRRVYTGVILVRSILQSKIAYSCNTMNGSSIVQYKVNNTEFGFSSTE